MAHHAARAEVRQQAAIIDAVSNEAHVQGLDTSPEGAEAITADLVMSFLLPEVQRQAAREAAKRHQQRLLHAAHAVRGIRCTHLVNHYCLAFLIPNLSLIANMDRNSAMRLKKSTAPFSLSFRAHHPAAAPVLPARYPGALSPVHAQRHAQQGYATASRRLFHWKKHSWAFNYVMYLLS